GGRRSERRVFVGMDVHNDAGVGRTGVVAATLRQGDDGRWAFVPRWKFDPETGRTYTGRAGLTVGSGQGFGCGGVWSSPAVDAGHRLVAFGTANCTNRDDARAAGELWSEAMFAVRASDGRLVWRFQPAAEHATRAAQDQDAG